jgi:transcriptional regulator with XRE-family HTH domain
MRTKATFGQVVRTARQQAGLTQEALADILGVDQSLVSFWERNDRHPAAKRLVALARALNIPATDLLATLENDEGAA